MTIRLPISLLGALALSLAAHAQTTVSNTTYGSGQNVTVVGPSTIQTSGAVTVSNGATVTFHASTGIWLNAGFQTQNGSLFSTLITPNVPPTVTPTGPASSTVTSSATVSLSFTAADAGDSVAKVEIYRNGVLVATLTSPTSGSTWTFTESSPLPPGTYTYEARAYNSYGTSTNSTVTTVTVLPVLPYLTDFEASDGYTLGSLDQQLGWSVSQGSALVTNQDAFHGTQSAALQPGTQPTLITQTFAPQTGENIIFFDFYAKPVAEATPATTFNVGNARFAFVIKGGQGNLQVFNGDGFGGGLWIATAFNIPLGVNNQAQNWVHLTARLDFYYETWDLYANGNMVAADVNLSDFTGTSLAFFTMQGDAATTTEIDDILAGPQNPLFVDSANDGIADSWKTAHGLNVNTNDRYISLPDGLPVIMSYVAGANPNAPPQIVTSSPAINLIIFTP
jgi:hypothetical protein